MFTRKRRKGIGAIYTSKSSEFTNSDGEGMNTLTRFSITNYRNTGDISDIIGQVGAAKVLASVLVTITSADDEGFLDFFEKRHGHPHEARHRHAARGHSNRHHPHAARHGQGHASARGHPNGRDVYIEYECPRHCCDIYEETVVSESYPPDQDGGDTTTVPAPTSLDVLVTTTNAPVDGSPTTQAPPSTVQSKRHGHAGKARHGSFHSKRHHV
ncbi:hypothetical protein Trydic_g14196 [Trypoxylus dichotomus]